MDITKIDDADKLKFMDLLLIADEQISQIEKYLYRGEMFALYDDGLKSVCIVTGEAPGVYEIKNIATVPEHQKKGYGRSLISFVENYYKIDGTRLYVGTGDCPSILDFYKKCGFTRSHVVKNFFIDNYDHPMYEDGQQLIDMIYLKKEIKSP